MRINLIIATAASLLAWQRRRRPSRTRALSRRRCSVPGVLTVSDELRQPPDTLIGARGFFGGINEEYVNDDGGPFAATFASEITGVPTNSGTIRFAVTGVTSFPDDSVLRRPCEAGRIEVFVEAFDSGGESAGRFSEIRTLQPGVVEEFMFSDLTGSAARTTCTSTT